MKKLLQGILDFRRFVFPAYRETFARLEAVQNPDCLFVACSDSRVVPNLFSSTNPGDLFVVRNIGNLITPAGVTTAVSTPAAIEFSVGVLGVSDIVVCGHSNCGAMRALLDGLPGAQAPHLVKWLEHARPALERFASGRDDGLDPALSAQDRLSQVNVLHQMDHALTHPLVRERVDAGKLRVHGWWFHVGTADVFAYEPDERRFHLIDEAEAARILTRLGS